MRAAVEPLEMALGKAVSGRRIREAEVGAGEARRDSVTQPRGRVRIVDFSSATFVVQALYLFPVWVTIYLPDRVLVSSTGAGLRLLRNRNSANVGRTPVGRLDVAD